MPDGITSLIGSNGAGKTTLLKSISGMIKRTGSITLDGEELDKEKGHSDCKMRYFALPRGQTCISGPERGTKPGDGDDHLAWLFWKSAF